MFRTTAVREEEQEEELEELEEEAKASSRTRLAAAFKDLLVPLQRAVISGAGRAAVFSHFKM